MTQDFPTARRVDGLISQRFLLSRIPAEWMMPDVFLWLVSSTRRFGDEEDAPSAKFNFWSGVPGFGIPQDVHKVVSPTLITVAP